MENEYDGVLIWDYLRRSIKPSTRVGASKLKGEIENITIDKFNNDLSKFDTWFKDTKAEVKGYNDNLCQLFCIYLTSKQEDFLKAIKEMDRLWIQGNLTDTYSYKYLMYLGLVTYNNLIKDYKYKPSTKGELIKQELTK